MMFKSIIENTAVTLIGLAVTELPLDVKQAIGRGLESETNGGAKAQLRSIIENYHLAETKKISMCQDTGTITFYVEVGEHFPIKSDLTEILNMAVKRATREIPLRSNAVNPFTGKNSGDNTGVGIPIIHWEVIPGDILRMTVFPKGGGSENTSVLGMLNPSLGIEGIKKFVVDTVVAGGGRPCPPIILGIGIGGGSDIALKLAKRALLRPLNIHHKNRKIAKLEEELLMLTNLTGIGPMGLGGDTTVLCVNIEYAYRHPASLPVGIVTQCWAARKASVNIFSNGRVEYLTHTLGAQN